ncbi:hypothetical protein BJF90_34110 [Pseudonocardia sp. CNS-004]|nr:hypothetical protein BJF90_34110 [Pseudonocardia sp. CNS-004]
MFVHGDEVVDDPLRRATAGSRPMASSNTPAAARASTRSDSPWRAPDVQRPAAGAHTSRVRSIVVASDSSATSIATGNAHRRPGWAST